MHRRWTLSNGAPRCSPAPRRSPAPSPGRLAARVSRGAPRAPAPRTIARRPAFRRRRYRSRIGGVAQCQFASLPSPRRADAAGRRRSGDRTSSPVRLGVATYCRGGSSSAATMGCHQGAIPATRPHLDTSDSDRVIQRRGRRTGGRIARPTWSTARCRRRPARARRLARRRPCVVDCRGATPCATSAGSREARASRSPLVARRRRALGSGSVRSRPT